MDPLNSIPKVTLPKSDLPVVDLDEVRFDGEPFPFPTVGDYRIDLSADAFMTMTVTFPIRLETADG